MVTRAPFGRMPDGRPVDVFTLTNGHGLEMRAISYGAIIVSIHAPDRAGHLDDVVLGHDDLAGYLAASPYFGAVVGRYANRIARGHLALEGRVHQLAINDPPNHLHGGVRGFDKRVWDAEEDASPTAASVCFRYASPAGEENYPGTLRVVVTYTLTDRDELRVDHGGAHGRDDGRELQPAFVLQPGRGRARGRPRSRAHPRRRPLPARGRDVDPHRRGGPGGGNAVRLPCSRRHRSPHRPGGRAARPWRRLRPLLRGAPLRPGPRGRRAPGRPVERAEARRADHRTRPPVLLGNRLDGRVRGKSGARVARAG